jgi:hypothetical protein
MTGVMRELEFLEAFGNLRTPCDKGIGLYDVLETVLDGRDATDQKTISTGSLAWLTAQNMTGCVRTIT